MDNFDTFFLIESVVLLLLENHNQRYNHQREYAVQKTNYQLQIDLIKVEYMPLCALPNGISTAFLRIIDKVPRRALAPVPRRNALVNVKIF